jgi:hypothetical protein
MRSASIERARGLNGFTILQNVLDGLVDSVEVVTQKIYSKLQNLTARQGIPGSSYEEEYERRVSAYTSACELCPKLPKVSPIHLPEPPLPKWPPTR